MTIGDVINEHWFDIFALLLLAILFLGDKK
jgi:hypothetical protein